MTGIAVAVDAMGGDFGPRVTVPASLAVLRENTSLRLTLVGDESLISPFLAGISPGDRARVQVLHTTEVVTMDDKVAVALRQKKQSSMRLAINLVHAKTVDACVSAGNTGALMAVSRFVLKTHADIDRPAILATLPTMIGHVHMLDLGANVDSEPRHLLQFAQMGSIIAEVLDGIERPRVGLLNIGEEEIKGNEQIKQTDELLRASDLNYIGYVEGDGIFKGHADVVVCDGFVGNIALKTAEGTAKLVVSYLRGALKRSLLSRLGALFASGALNALRRKLDPRNANGGMFLGLNGIVVKSHGGTDAPGFASAIDTAVDLADAEINKRIVADRAGVDIPGREAAVS